MNDNLSSSAKDEIVESSVHDSSSTAWRRLFFFLAALATLFAAMAIGAMWFAYEKVHSEYDKAAGQANEGVDLAVELQQLCDSRGAQLSKKGIAVCNQADEVVKAGSPGEQGPTGPTGPQGPQGIQGPQGPQGPIGRTGQNGPTGTSGTNGEQGATGDTGAAGQQGDIGPQGPQGERGAQGDPGQSAYPFDFDFTVDNVVGSTTYHVHCASTGQPCEVTQS